MTKRAVRMINRVQRRILAKISRQVFTAVVHLNRVPTSRLGLAIFVTCVVSMSYTTPKVVRPCPRNPSCLDGPTVALTFTHRVN